MYSKATATLEAIEKQFQLDGGDKYRALLKKNILNASDAYRAVSSPFRGHLGASLIGRKCQRELWLSFRWATLQNFSGRMVRLFNRGHLEEARFVSLLESIGCEVFQTDENGHQFKITGYKGHFGGSLDSVVVGLPEFKEEAVLAEFKTHNKKSFEKLVEEGVILTKPEHYAQMIVYMGAYGLGNALYLAVNKDNDDIHAEFVQFDEHFYNELLQKAQSIIDNVSPPPRISESPGWYECRFCQHLDCCQKSIPPQKNCRTCQHSTPTSAGDWICERDSQNFRIGEALQLNGCNFYEEHPHIRERY